jgi:ligand-binding SRPBCC domain-containing protein
MAVIELKTRIEAPIDRCFDLARSIDFHVVTTGKTQERAVGGRTTGLIALGETVTWKAKHFGLWQELTVKVTGFDRPRHFQDVMTQGAFSSMAHDHRFESLGGATVMSDHFLFKSPMGPLGAIADQLFLKNYMARFLEERALILKATAESNDWQRFLHP